MATLYSTNTTLQDILNMRVGDELRLSGDELPDYTEEDAGKALVVNQSGTGLEWGSELPSYNSSDLGKVLTVEAGELEETVVVPEQTVTITTGKTYSILTGTDDSLLQNIEYGSKATAIINGTTYRAIGAAVPGGEFGAYHVPELNAVFAYISKLGGAVFGIQGEEPETGTYTVFLKALVTTVAPVWESPETLPDYSSAQENDVLTIKSGNPVWWSVSKEFVIHTIQIFNVPDNTRTDISSIAFTTLDNAKAFAQTILDEIYADKVVVIRVKYDSTSSTKYEKTRVDLFLVHTYLSGSGGSTDRADSAIFQSADFNSTGSNVKIRTLEISATQSTYYTRQTKTIT